jgi:hypothetical protein
MAGSVRGAGCHIVVHATGDIRGHDDAHENENPIKQCVALFYRAGTWLAKTSPSLLIQPYQLLGENHV